MRVFGVSGCPSFFKLGFGHQLERLIQNPVVISECDWTFFAASACLSVVRFRVGRSGPSHFVARYMRSLEQFGSCQRLACESESSRQRFSVIRRRPNGEKMAKPILVDVVCFFKSKAC